MEKNANSGMEELIYDDFHRLEIVVRVVGSKPLEGSKSYPILEVDYRVITVSCFSGYKTDKLVQSDPLYTQELNDYMYSFHDYVKNHEKLNKLFQSLWFFDFYSLYSVLNFKHSTVHQIYEKGFKEEPELWENYLIEKPKYDALLNYLGLIILTKEELENLPLLDELEKDDLITPNMADIRVKQYFEKLWQPCFDKIHMAARYI